MNPDLDIFLDAPEISSPEKLAAYLDEACGGDQSLREKVEALFAADRIVDGIVDHSPKISGSSQDCDAVKTVIENYKLLQKIGEGGFGEVFLAEQLRPVKRRVALKIIKLGMDTKQVVARFEAERQALAMMDHPNIAKVFDAGATETGRPYFVMDLVRGIPITKFCDEGELSLEQRTKLFMVVCQAVQHAHQKGIIHRDLKPSNILVTMDGDQPVPKVIDFGVAKATQARLTEKTLFTRFEMFIGTPAYMSPEQAHLNELDIDTRSDIYALGVLLYELLTGATPFDSAALVHAGYDEIRRKIREEEPPAISKRIHTMSAEDVTNLAAKLQTDPSQLRAAMRNDLDWIVMKAMEKQRARRYESATAFANDLQRFLDREPVLAHPPTRVYRFAKFFGKHQTAMGLAALFVLLLVLGATGVIWQWRQAVTNASIAEKQTELATERTRETKEALQESLTNEGRTWLEKAQLYAGEPGSGFAASLMAARAIGFEGFGRNLQGREFKENFPNLLKGNENLFDEARELIRRHERAPRPIWSTPATLGHEKRVVAICYSPDGELIASADKDGVIIIWEAESSRRLVTLAEHREEVTSLAFSPDGKTLASASMDQMVILWRRDQRWKALPLIGHSAAVRGVAFPADGRFLASAGGDGKIKLWDPESGELLRTLEDSATPQEGASVFSLGAGGQIAAYATETSIKLLDLESGAVRDLPGSGPGVVSLAISPDEKWLASGAKNAPCRMWNLENETFLAEFDHEIPEKFAKTANGVRFSQDGKWLAYGKGYRVVVWKMTASGTPKEPRMFSGHHSFAKTLAWGPEGKSLVSSGFDRRLIQWNLDQQFRPPRDPGGHVDFLKAVARSPDGRWVATAGEDSVIRIWEMGTGHLIQTLRGHREGVFDLAFHPDGHQLASASYSDQEIILWDLDSGTRMASLPHSGPSHGGGCVTFSPDGSYLAGGGRNGVVNLWDLEREQKVASIPAQSQTISRLAFSPDSRFLASASQDSTIHLWSIEQLDKLEGEADWILGGHIGAVLHLDFSSDGRWLASSGADGTVRLWDYRAIAQGTPIKETTVFGSSPDPNLRYPVTAAFSPDSRHLAIGDWSGRVTIWDPESRTSKQAFSCHDHEVSMMTFGPDGKSLVTASRDHTARCWELGGPMQDLFQSRTAVASLCVTSDGSQWITGHDDGTVTVWDAQRGLVRHEFHGHKGRVRCVAVSPDDRVIASAGDEGGIILRERESGRLIQKLSGHERAVLSISISGDGKTLASAGKDGRILIWDLNKCELLREISQEERWVRCVDFSPDGTMLAGGKNGLYAAVWDVASGEELFTLPVHEDLVTCVSFSPDGTWLATSCSVNGRIRLWHVDEFRTGSAPAPSLTSLSLIGGSLLAFDDKGDRLVEGGWQPTLGVWEIDEIGRIEQPLTFSGRTSSPVRGLAFTPENNSIVTAGKNGTIIRWYLERPSADLASYLAENWVVIDGRHISQPQKATGFDEFRSFDNKKALPSSHVGILQETEIARSTTERLFSAYLRAHNLAGALAIWTQIENSRYRDEAFRDLTAWVVQSKQTNSVVPDVLTWQLKQLEGLAKKAGQAEWQKIVRSSRAALATEEEEVVPLPRDLPSLTGRWINNNGGIRLHFDQQGREVVVREVHSNRYWKGKIDGNRITLTSNSLGSKYMEGTFTGKLTDRFTGIEWDVHEDHWRMLREE